MKDPEAFALLMRFVVKDPVNKRSLRRALYGFDPEKVLDDPESLYREERTIRGKAEVLADMVPGLSLDTAKLIFRILYGPWREAILRKGSWVNWFKRIMGRGSDWDWHVNLAVDTVYETFALSDRDSRRFVAEVIKRLGLKPV